jgi:UDP-N-acetylmuramoylalanine--D-glutamate ligase
LISFINDSKATNVESTLYAFESLTEEVYWIAGGKYLGADLSLLLQNLNKIRKCYFFGESKFALYELFSPFVKCLLCENLEEAFYNSVKDASLSTVKCTLLFSPAHKSFDQFKNFEERGLAFMQLCKNLINA